MLFIDDLPKTKGLIVCVLSQQTNRFVNTGPGRPLKYYMGS